MNFKYLGYIWPCLVNSSTLWDEEFHECQVFRNFQLRNLKILEILAPIFFISPNIRPRGIHKLRLNILAYLPLLPPGWQHNLNQIYSATLTFYEALFPHCYKHSLWMTPMVVQLIQKCERKDIRWKHKQKIGTKKGKLWGCWLETLLVICSFFS